MAVLKDLNGYHYRDSQSRETVVGYIMQPDKTPDGFIGCTGVDPLDIPNSMHQTAAYYNKDSGVRLRHMILSFSHAELTNPEVAYEIGCAVMCYIGAEYQTAFAVHQDAANLHIHFVFSSISFVDGRRYRGTRSEYYSLVKKIESILRPYGIRYLRTVSRRSSHDVQADTFE